MALTWQAFGQVQEALLASSRRRRFREGLTGPGNGRTDLSRRCPAQMVSGIEGTFKSQHLENVPGNYAGEGRQLVKTERR